jgi:hypothetical protein
MLLYNYFLRILYLSSTNKKGRSVEGVRGGRGLCIWGFSTAIRMYREKLIRAGVCVSAHIA